MEAIPTELLEFPSSIYYILLPFVLILAIELSEGLYSRNLQRAKSQRELYYQRLVNDALELETKRLEEEIAEADRVQELVDECNNLRSQLIYDGSAGSKSTKELRDELDHLQAKTKEVDDVVSDIKLLSKESNVSMEPSELNEWSKKLEAENEHLRAQLESCEVDTPATLDPEVLKFIEENDHLTLESLKKTLGTLVELGLDQNCLPRKTQADITKLKLKLRKAEIELKHMKDKYEKELSSCEAIEIELILKNSGAREYVDKMKDKNKITQDLVEATKKKLETNRNEAEIWRKKYDETEKQCKEYQVAYRVEKNKNVELEAKLSANHQIMNMSSASSIHERIPSPPPVEMPPIAELLKKYGNPTDNDVPYNKTHRRYM